MREETVARSYAEALFELGSRDDRREEYGAALESVARIVAENTDARLFLETPRIDAEDKKRVLRATFSDQLPKNVLNFLLVIVDKRRQRLLREISRAYQDLLDVHLGRTHVEVTVARRFSDEDVGALSRRLSRVLGQEVVAHVRVDPNVVGGIKLRTGDTVYDGTLRRRLDRIRRSLLAAQLPEPGRLADAAEAG